jgi:DNA repair photolyase
MAIKESKGNMYSFVTHQWNPVRGECAYKCAYCYVGRWGRAQNPPHIDRKDLKSPLGAGRFIFICSGCDLFHPDVPGDWIADVRNRTLQYPNNKYLWHTKNPQRLVELIEPGPADVACVTIESNIYRSCISAAPAPHERAMYLRNWEGRKMITVEPIMDFSVADFADLILSCKPDQVNIGADSGGNGLPEPTLWKIEALIYALEENGITVRQKKNLNRLILM